MSREMDEAAYHDRRRASLPHNTKEIEIIDEERYMGHAPLSEIFTASFLAQCLLLLSLSRLHLRLPRA